MVIATTKNGEEFILPVYQKICRSNEQFVLENTLPDFGAVFETRSSRLIGGISTLRNMIFQNPESFDLTPFGKTIL